MKSLPPYREWLAANIPRTWTADAAHIREIALHLDALTSGEIDRLAIFMPPRHGKTEVTTVRYPVYHLAGFPEQNVLVTGYNERFARRMSRKARMVAGDVLPLDKKKRATDEWATTQGTVLMARGVGSPPTGTGFGLIAIDDPIRKREDAESEVYREKVWDWFTDDLYTRLEPGGKILLVMTPWHEDDIGQRAIKSEPGRWTVLKLPALATEDDPLGRAVGEALWPERWSVEALCRIRDVMAQNEGLRSWEALYQCNPTPREGLFFKVGNLAIVDALPASLRLCRAWDLAATEGGGDFTVGALIGVDGEGFWYVCDIHRGQWGPDGVDAHLRQVTALDGPGIRSHLPQDPGQAGKKQAAQLTRMLAGVPITAEVVSGTKTTRAYGFAAQVNAGNVRLLRADWNRDFIEELRTFPNGKHDDQVDAASDGFNQLAGQHISRGA